MPNRSKPRSACGLAEEKLVSLFFAAGTALGLALVLASAPPAGAQRVETPRTIHEPAGRLDSTWRIAPMPVTSARLR